MAEPSTSITLWRSKGVAPKLRASFAAQLRCVKLERVTDGNREEIMDLLWTLVIILLVLWLLGLVTSYTLGGFIHLLLLVAVIVILIRVIQGRRPIP